jgi:hypothetical protein
MQVSVATSVLDPDPRIRNYFASLIRISSVLLLLRIRIQLQILAINKDLKKFQK